MKPALRFVRTLSVGCLVLAGVLVPEFASAAPAQIGIEPQPCVLIPQPVPSGATFRPADDFNSQGDYNYVHSSTNLQGRPAKEKFAAGLFWLPPAPAELSSFQSAVAVTNPDPVASTVVTINFYDLFGTLVGTQSFNLGPEGTWVVPASPLQSIFSLTPGLGSAWVIGSDLAIVGETVHHATTVDLSGFRGPLLSEPEPGNFGLNSLQQLQMSQAGKDTLWFGPMPVSNTAPLDFLTGTAPLIWVVNPSPTTPTTVTLRYSSLGGVVLPPVTVTLPAHGAVLDQTLWNLLLPTYLAPSGSFDDDFRLVVSATGPIVGDALMVDLFGGTSLSAGQRFRMGSAMLANSPSAQLVNPELTFQAGPPSVETIVGLYNPTLGNVGPVAVQYFDRNGASLGVDSFASFPRGFMVRIGPGLPASPNYPVAGVFAGYMRITACVKGLVGWTMRQGSEVGHFGAAREVWGEELTGANGLEPGPGFLVTVGSETFMRKVSPLVRAGKSAPWPGYTTWVNDGASNSGNYWFRFFDQLGANQSTAAGQFAGLRFGRTSFTYEDPLVSPNATTNLSGRVDTTNGGFDGIHVIGDPLWEWGIFNFDND